MFGKLGVDLLSPKWASNAELLAWKEAVVPVLAGFCLAVCVLAQILFYIFPRLRVFPRSLLSWVNIYNLTYEITIIMKWSPYSALHKPWVLDLRNNPLLCKAGVMMDNAGLLGPVCCTLLMCLTLFLGVVMRINIEGKRVYFWSFLAFATLYPLAFGFTVVFAYPATSAFGVCLISVSANIPIRISYCILFFTQLALFVATMVYVKRAFTNVNHINASTNNFPMSYLLIRFGAIFLTQMFGLLPAQVATIFQEKSILENAIFNRIVSVTRNLGTMLDAFVMILGNADFMEWLRRQWNTSRFSASTPSTESSNRDIELQNNSPQMIEAGIAREIEHVETEHLSTSSEKMGTSTPKHLSMHEKTSLETQESSDIRDDIV